MIVYRVRYEFEEQCLEGGEGVSWSWPETLKPLVAARLRLQNITASADLPSADFMQSIELLPSSHAPMVRGGRPPRPFEVAFPMAEIWRSIRLSVIVQYRVIYWTGFLYSLKELKLMAMA